MVNEVNVITSKTKSGKEIRVAVIPQSMAPGMECHFAASAIAVSRGCTHWRVIDAAGNLFAAGRAVADVNGSHAYGSFGPQG